MEPSSCDVWVTSVDLVSEVSCLECPVGVGNWLLLTEIPHVWYEGQNPDSLFSTICVWGEAQGQGNILCWTEQTEPLPRSLQFQNSWRKSYLIKWVVTCPAPNTQTFCVLGQVILQCPHVNNWPGYMSFLKGLAVKTGEGNGSPLQYSYLENSMNLVGCSSWGCKDSDTTEWLTT